MPENGDEQQPSLFAPHRATDEWGGDIGVYFTTSRIGLPHGNWALMQAPRFNKLGYRQPTNLASRIGLNWVRFVKKQGRQRDLCRP
jgi:hypothetical protein